MPWKTKSKRGKAVLSRKTRKPIRDKEKPTKRSRPRALGSSEKRDYYVVRSKKTGKPILYNKKPIKRSLGSKKDYYLCSVRECQRLAVRKIRYHGEDVYLCSHHDLNSYEDIKELDKQLSKGTKTSLVSVKTFPRKQRVSRNKLWLIKYRDWDGEIKHFKTEAPTKVKARKTAEGVLFSEHRDSCGYIGPEHPYWKIIKTITVERTPYQFEDPHGKGDILTESLRKK